MFPRIAQCWAIVGVLALALVHKALADLARLAPRGLGSGRTTVANALWGLDAFPGTPTVPPHGRLTLAYFNASGGGRVTQMHLVLDGAEMGEIQRHVALSITYNDASTPSVFVPVGDFFLDQLNGESAPFESKLFAKRPTNSWFSLAPIPYERSVRVELVNALSSPIGGYTYIYHDGTPFDAVNDGYFHAYYSPNSLLAFPWQPAPLLPVGGIHGRGHLVGTAMIFSSAQPDNFGGNFDHVCEGNYELFLDNTTVLSGNDTSTAYRKAGYQTSDHVVAILGSEDYYGYSFGWAGNESTLGKIGMYGTQNTGTTVRKRTPSSAVLATYRFIEHPIRFTDSLHAQVNWGYDVGHNVPRDLCPHGTGCPIAYETMMYFYLAEPRDASPDQSGFPWPYPLTPPNNTGRTWH